MYNFKCKKGMKTYSSPEYVQYWYNVTDYLINIMGDVVESAYLYLENVYTESSEEEQLQDYVRIDKLACFIDNKFKEQGAVKLENEFHLRVYLKNGCSFMFNGCEFGSISV